MSNSIEQSLKQLASFLFSNNIVVTKTKSAKGFMIYQPSQVTDIAKLESLAASVNWKVSFFEPTYDKGTLIRDASIYVGPRSTAKDFASEDDFIASLS